MTRDAVPSGLGKSTTGDTRRATVRSRRQKRRALQRAKKAGDKKDFSPKSRVAGKGKDTTVHTRYQDLVPKVPGQEGSLARPDDEDVAETEVRPLRSVPVHANLPL